MFGTNEGFETGQQVDNREGRLVGQVVIPVLSLFNQRPVDTWFRLVNPKLPRQEPGEIHLKLQYTPMTVNTSLIHHLLINSEKYV